MPEARFGAAISGDLRCVREGPKAKLPMIVPCPAVEPARWQASAGAQEAQRREIAGRSMRVGA